jgi:hypothetical protein
MSFKPRLIAYLCLLFVGVVLVYAPGRSEEAPLASLFGEEIVSTSLAEPDTANPPCHGVPLRARQTAGTADVYAVDWPVRAY